MFDRFKERFNKKEELEEEISFKPYTEIERPEPQPAEEEPAYSPAPEKESGAGVELKVVRPEAYDDVSIVADHLLAGCTVVLNMEVLDRPTIHRMLDFLNGVTYCTDGEIKKVAPNTFIITPHSDIDISDM